MTTSRKASARSRSDTLATKAVRALVEGTNRVLEALAPRPQLQPIPVRVRRGRGRDGGQR